MMQGMNTMREEGIEFVFTFDCGVSGLLWNSKLNCSACPYIEPGTVIQSCNTSKKIEINGTFNCRTRNVVYCITCEQCKLQYIGQTTRSLHERVSENIGYIRNLHTNQPTGEHFNLFDMNPILRTF